MDQVDERSLVEEQLYEALSATDPNQKNFHIRQAIQLLRIED